MSARPLRRTSLDGCTPSLSLSLSLSSSLRVGVLLASLAPRTLSFERGKARRGSREGWHQREGLAEALQRAHSLHTFVDFLTGAPGASQRFDNLEQRTKERLVGEPRKFQIETRFN